MLSRRLRVPLIPGIPSLPGASSSSVMPSSSNLLGAARTARIVGWQHGKKLRRRGQQENANHLPWQRIPLLCQALHVTWQ